MLEELHCSGVGDPIQCDRVKSIADLRNGCATSNEALIREMRADPEAETLLECTRADAALGRMTMPVPYKAEEWKNVLLHPRFSVTQAREDGSVKVRPIDNLSWSTGASSKAEAKAGSVNGHVSPTEKLRHDTLDAFAAALCIFVALFGVCPALLKVRRYMCCVSPCWSVLHVAEGGCGFCFPKDPCPSRPSMGMWSCFRCPRDGASVCGRCAVDLACDCDAQVMASRHAACPFGAIGSVHAWERVGAGIAFIIRKLLMIAGYRYVDDFFAAERHVVILLARASCSVYCVQSRKETIDHALSCIARVADALLGPGAAAPNKLHTGMSLVSSWACGCRCLPGDFSSAPRKRRCIALSPCSLCITRCMCVQARKWIATMTEALSKEHLGPGAASKLAGKLAWGCSKLFHRFGRAMLRYAAAFPASVGALACTALQADL